MLPTLSGESIVAMTESEIDVLRQRMSYLRGRISNDAADMASSARRLTDWRYHFRKMPWVAIGGAAAFGFLLVPRKQRAAERAADLTQEKLIELARSINPSAMPKQPSFSLGRMLLSSVGGPIAKAAAGIVATQVAAVMAGRAAAPAQAEESPESELPPRQPR
jgi:hypothetical protein